MNTTLIELCLGPIFEDILEVEETVLIRHAGNLKHKGSELFDIIADATHFLKQTNARSFLFLGIAQGKVLTDFLLELRKCIYSADTFVHFTMLSSPP